jgi:hypothetical protein
LKELVEGTEVKLEEKYNERKRPGKIPLKKALLEHIEEEVNGTHSTYAHQTGRG